MHTREGGKPRTGAGQIKLDQSERLAQLQQWMRGTNGDQTAKVMGPINLFGEFYR
jgi:hypothetical protein